MSRTAFACALLSLRGDDGDGAVALVLGLVVVELFGGHDLADDRGFRIVVAEHGDFELAGAVGGFVLCGFPPTPCSMTILRS